MLRYQISRPVLAISRWNRRLLCKPPGFRILIFHDVPPSDRQAFEDLIGYLTANRAVISPDQAAAWISGDIPKEFDKRGGTQPCVISFDDGFTGNHELAENVLPAHNVKALFFVCPGLINLQGDAQLHAVRKNVIIATAESKVDDIRLQLMSWSQIQELASEGHTIGAHGMTHLSLEKLQGEVLRDEIVTSGDCIEERISRTVNWYAFAFGGIENISAPAMQVIKERFSFCRAGVRGANTATTNPYAILGDHVDLSAPEAYQHLTIEGGLDPIYKAKRKRLHSLL